MRNLNKNNVLTTIEAIDRTLKEKYWENNFKNMGTICTQFHKIRKFFCSVIQGLKEKMNTVKRLTFNIFFKKQAQNNTTETSDEPVPTT